jgi:hypothetical protein
MEHLTKEQLLDIEFPIIKNITAKQFVGHMGTRWNAHGMLDGTRWIGTTKTGETAEEAVDLLVDFARSLKKEEYGIN